MRTLFVSLVIFHGLIHILGFAKAFNLSKIKEFILPISKSAGLMWLFASILLTITGFLYAFEISSWWLPAIIGIVISQVLIFYFWKDAKFGTIPNLIILVISIVGYANYNFQQITNSEINSLLSEINFSDSTIVDQNMIVELPIAVQNWLTSSGTVGKPIINSIFLKQKALMRMSSDQTDWYEAEAQQYFSAQSPAFVWKVNMQMMTLLEIVGRDKLENGKGEMLIKILGLFLIAHTKDNIKLNMGSLQRYLAEIVWFPSAALSNNISWTSVNDSTANATININGISGSGTFYFNKNGSLKYFSALRYFGGEENSELIEWIITPSEHKIINGIRIPNKSTATWKLENGDWDWLQVEITDIEYNIRNL